jgi:hypothetical protein
LLTFSQISVPEHAPLHECLYALYHFLGVLLDDISDNLRIEAASVLSRVCMRVVIPTLPFVKLLLTPLYRNGQKSSTVRKTSLKAVDAIVLLGKRKAAMMKDVLAMLKENETENRILIEFIESRKEVT